MFNRVSIGFNRLSLWNRIIIGVRYVATNAIPAYVRTRIELVKEIVRIGG